jgi:putative endonuclease
MANTIYSCYIVRCSDGSYYCGISNDVTARILTHNSGRGSKYVKSRLPVVLVYVEQCGSKSEALRREYQIKQLSRSEKVRLIDMCDKKQA